jgi:hypothetical protein
MAGGLVHTSTQPGLSCRLRVQRGLLPYLQVNTPFNIVSFWIGRGRWSVSRLGAAKLAPPVIDTEIEKAQSIVITMTLLGAFMPLHLSSRLKLASSEGTRRCVHHRCQVGQRKCMWDGHHLRSARIVLVLRIGCGGAGPNNFTRGVHQRDGQHQSTTEGKAVPGLHTREETYKRASFSGQNLLLCFESIGPVWVAKRPVSPSSVKVAPTENSDSRYVFVGLVGPCLKLCLGPYRSNHWSRRWG